MENDRSYFTRRAAQERTAADQARNNAARDAHLDMERRYRELVGFARPKAATRFRPAM
jgi:hypothetical protein